MNQYVSQEEVRRIIINDMVKKKSSIVPLVLLWLSFGALKWIRNAFKERLKVVQRYTPLTDIGLLIQEVSLVASWTFVLEVMNTGDKMKFSMIALISQSRCQRNKVYNV